MTQFELIDRVEVGNTLGECVLWNERQETVWWTDILEARLYKYACAERALITYELPECLASFGFTDNDESLICAFASGFALYEPESQKIDWLARPEKDLPGNRFNDGRVDRQGRFWAGTKVEQLSAASNAKGSLYCLAGREYKKILSGISISNSICWSPDNSRFYFADSPTHTINAYDFDPQAGTIGSPEIFTRTPPPYEPDGSTVDAQGFLWNAMWGSGKVIRYDNKGQPADELVLPVSQPTCVAFGGSSMNQIFVTSAKIGLTAEQLQKEPQAGDLLIYRTPYLGLRESRFKV
jgi:L-arabinonolactonase